MNFRITRKSVNTMDVVIISNDNDKSVQLLPVSAPLINTKGFGVLK